MVVLHLISQGDQLVSADLASVLLETVRADPDVLFLGHVNPGHRDRFCAIVRTPRGQVAVQERISATSALAGRWQINALGPPPRSTVSRPIFILGAPRSGTYLLFEAI